MIPPKAKRAKLDAVEETNDIDNHDTENNTNYSNDPEHMLPFQGETGDFIKQEIKYEIKEEPLEVEFVHTYLIAIYIREHPCVDYFSFTM